MKEIKNIDKLFKHGLEDPVDKTEFREDDWNAFEQMLDGDKTPGKVYWLRIFSSVAAILLAIFGWWLFKPRATTQVQNTQQVANNSVHKAQPTVISGYNIVSKKRPSAKTNAVSHIQQIAASSQLAKNGKVQFVGVNAPGKVREQMPQQKQVQSHYLANNINNINHTKYSKNHTSNQLITNGIITDPIENNAAITGQNNSDNASDRTMLTAYNPTPDIAGVNSMGMPVIASATTLPKAYNNDAIAENKLAIKKTGTAFRPQFALTVLASSELNGVGSLAKTSSGTNVGLLFSMGVKKLSLTTGANYSIKPYTLPFDQYHTTYTFKNQPQSVTADCRVLDIPINLDYQVYNRSRNKISLGTGVSSYIMMHESYTYDYGNTGSVYGPSYYAVKGKGKYLFSIMNLQATYQRQVNSKVGISLQPYLKIPLSDIGYSQVKVQTFGVAVGLSWNINSLTKPN